VVATNEAAFTRPRVRGSRGRLGGLVSASLFLALVALFLLPTAHANVRIIAQVNGQLLTIPASSATGAVASEYLALARPGSKLDITGDVVSIGEGSPVKTEVNATPAAADLPLADGSVVTVSHGDNLLEGLVKKTETIPFQTASQGSGAFVRLVHNGTPGEKTIYQGKFSHKQAAVFTITPPENAVLGHSSAAKPGQKLAALTFDDGPGKWTQGVLDALAAKEAPATFFILGSSAAHNQALIHKIKAAGHEVENHSWSHPILTQLSDDEVRREISRTDAAIGGGRFLRPPYGTYDATVVSIAQSMGYRLVLWTVDTLDWKHRDPDSILSLVKEQTKPGAIILMHDGGVDRSQTVAAIPRVVDWLLQSGYSLTTVENLL